MPTIREYLVSLGAEVDNKSFSKFNAALNGAGKSVAVFSAGMAALMTMVAKTSISLDKTTQSYEKMAEKQKKSIEMIRAQETALKILGKTEKEVKADKQLKEQYDTLKKIGEEIKLPTANEGIKSLRGLLQDFDKFRMVSTYAMNWINQVFLSKIRAPMEEMRKNLRDFTDKLKYNMPKISNIVGGVFSDIFRLAMAGVNAISKLISNFDKIPDVVKRIGTVIAVAFGLSKLHPAVTGLLVILALLDDYQTYLRGGQSALGDFWAAMENGTAVQYLLDELGKVPTKIKEIEDSITAFLETAFAKGNEIAQELLKGINEHDFGADGKAMAGFFGKLVTDMLNFINTNFVNGSEFFTSMAEVGGALVAGLAEALGTAIAKFPWMETFNGLMTGANNILSVIGEMLFGEEGSGEDKTKYQGLIEHFKTAAKNIVGGIGAAFLAISPSDVAKEISGLFENLFGLIGRAFSPDKNKSVDDLNETLLVTATDIGTKLFQIIGQTFEKIPWDTAGETIGNAMNSIFERIITWLGIASSNLPFLLHNAKANMKKVATGLLTFLGSAFKTVKLNDVSDMIKGVVTLFTDLLHEALAADPKGEGILSGAFSLVGNIAISLVQAILGGFANIPYTAVGKDIGAAVNRIFEFIGKLFTETVNENGDKTFSERFGDMAGTVIQIAQGIVNGIAAAFGPGGISFTTVSTSIKSVITGLFTLIGSAFSGKNLASLEKLGFSLINVAKDIAIGLMNGIANAFSGDDGIQFGDVTDKLTGIVNTLFSLIGKVFAPENIDAVLKSGLNLVTAGVGVVQGIIQAIGNGFAQLKVTDIGKSMGNGIAQLFKTLSGWISSQGVNSGKSFGITANAVLNIAKSIIGAIGTALATIKDSGSLSEFAGSIVTFLSDAVAQMAKDIKDEKLDFTKIGEGIGQAIGDALTIGIDFLSNFVGQVIDWIGTDGASDLLQIGQAIVEGIIAGVGNIWDIIMKKLFGEDYVNAKGESASASEHYGAVLGKMEENPGMSFDEANAAVTMEEAGETTSVTTSHASGTAMTYEQVQQEIALAWKNYMNYGNTPAGMSKSDLEALARLKSSNDEDKAFKMYDIFARRYGFKATDELSEYEQILSAMGEGRGGESIPQVQVDITQAEANINQIKEDLNSIPSDTYTTHHVVEDNQGGGNALGGRFSTATRGVFGEDGTEYIIPITKPARAKALIMQMFQEMGAGASNILSELGATGSSGIGGPGSSWSSQPAAMYPQAGGSVKSNSDNTVSVPTTINVYGSGDAMMAGQAAARASQSNVLRAVRGVVGA